jgi:pimeloyl-ACP methyl ester carboxylesterase
MVSVGGRNVRILEGGSGPNCVVLHHSTGSPGWTPLHDQLATKFRVTAPDMPGFGQSDRPDWAREPRDIGVLVNKTLDKLGLEGVTLVGAGLGGFIAAEMAVMNESRLSRLVLIGAAGLQPEEGEILDQMMIDFEEYVKSGFRDDASYAQVFGEAAPAEIKQLWDYSREMTARLTWKPYMFSRKLPHLLSEISKPTLIVWGANDKVVPVACAQQYARSIPGAKLEMVASAGHLVEFEQPADIAAMIARHAGLA